jgi:hypothetical protein
MEKKRRRRRKLIWDRMKILAGWTWKVKNRGMIGIIIIYCSSRLRIGGRKRRLFWIQETVDLENKEKQEGVVLQLLEGGQKKY